MFKAFNDKAQYRSYEASLADELATIESSIAQTKRISGYCCVCGRIRTFKVSSGTMLGPNPNLREGMTCECGLSNRNRLIYAMIQILVRANQYSHLAILEEITSLFRALKKEYPNIVGSEYVNGESQYRGAQMRAGRFSVRNEDICNLSFPSNTLDLLIHNDVLEHVFDYKKALHESLRVLRDGGSLLFTCPFFSDLDETQRRAIVKEDGSIEHLEQPEYHGNPLSKEGVLAFYHFGWDLLSSIRETGFVDVRLCVNWDPIQGFLSTNYPGDIYQKMLPLVFVATK